MMPGDVTCAQVVMKKGTGVSAGIIPVGLRLLACMGIQVKPQTAQERHQRPCSCQTSTVSSNKIGECRQHPDSVSDNPYTGLMEGNNP